MLQPKSSLSVAAIWKWMKREYRSQTLLYNSIPVPLFQTFKIYFLLHSLLCDLLMAGNQYNIIAATSRAQSSSSASQSIVKAPRPEMSHLGSFVVLSHEARDKYLSHGMNQKAASKLMAIILFPHMSPSDLGPVTLP